MTPLHHRRKKNILPLDFLAACSGISQVIQCDDVSLEKELYWVIYCPPQRPGQDSSVLQVLHPHEFQVLEVTQPLQSLCQAAFPAAQPKPSFYSLSITLL